MRFVFTLTIFIGAFLLFLVQPMFARMLLPKLGGSPSVWNTAMVFYQAALLGGYAYAHFSVQKFGPRRQTALHLALIFLPLVVLPIGLAAELTPPSASQPILWMLGTMTLAVGLPFFVVSTTSPLLQRWFHATDDPQSRDPYFLYAASNAGSLLALLAYPTLIEPNFSLETQSRIWSWGYGLLILLLLGCGLLLRGSGQREAVSEEAKTGAQAERISPQRRLHWILLAFVPSSLMLSVTTYLTTDIAAVPLLWIIPLTLYLLTFIFVFAARPLIPHALVLKAFPIILLPLVVIIAAKANSPLTIVMAFHLLAFFVTTLACHGELARDRPSPVRLTEFYLWMSVGGVLGGAFNALAAPLIFRSVMEYPLALVLACLMVTPAVLKSDNPKKNELARVIDFALPVMVGVACAFLILLLQQRGLTSDRYVLGVMFGLPALTTFSFSRRPLRFALAMAAIFLASTLRTGKDESVLASARSFFGIYRVERVNTATGSYHRFFHGSTLHGMQSVEPGRLQEPLTYYARSGPMGEAIQALRKKQGASFDSVGAVGLGVGTAASYATPNQQWTFYEIDPIVQQIAEDPKYFTYLRDCLAPYKIVIGDGRLQLETAPNGSYDLLILDAYSSDSLPVHLLTREALQLYARKLSPNGVMIFNTSNRHIELGPQMAALANSLGWAALQFNDSRLTAAQESNGKTGSQWVILGRTTKDFGTLATDGNWHPLPSEENVVPWTDNYSSLLSVFKWK